MSRNRPKADNEALSAARAGKNAEIRAVRRELAAVARDRASTPTQRARRKGELSARLVVLWRELGEIERGKAGAGSAAVRLRDRTDRGGGETGRRVQSGGETERRIGNGQPNVRDE